MANQVEPLDAAVQAEWDALRAEIAARDAQSFQLMTGSITVATALLTLFATLAGGDGAPNGLPIGLYYVPFAIMLPSLYLIINNAHCSSRIGSYIETHLESRSDLEWEGALSRFYGKLGEVYDVPWWKRYGARPFEEARVMYAVFIGLGVLDALVFWFYGAWGSLATASLTKALLLAVPLIAFVDAAVRTFGRRCARQHYPAIWAAVMTNDDEELLRGHGVDQRP